MVTNDFDKTLEEEEELLGEDDEIFRQWKEERMKFLKKQVEDLNLNEVKDIRKEQKTFGIYQRIGRDQFVDFIDKEDESTFVVLHLFDHQNRDCIRLNSCLEDIAKKYYKVKFGHIIATETKQDFDQFSLPIIIVYRGGADSPFRTIIKAQEFLDPNFDFDDVEQFLIEQNIVNPSLADPTYDK